MNRDKKLGIGLAGVSLLAAIGAGLFYAISDGSIPIVVLVWPALGILTGAILFFFSFIETELYIEDEIQQFPKLIQDDVDEFRKGVLSPTHVVVLVTLVAVAAEVALILWFRKAEAFWGPFNVLALAAVVFIFALVIVLRSDRFQKRRDRLPLRFYLVPAVGWFICTMIGITLAEPQEFGGRSRIDRANESAAETSFIATRSASAYYALDMGADAVTAIDCDGDDCLFVLLIAVVVASVLASAYIPHFWVVASILLLTLMVVYALRELLYREGPY